MNFRIALIAALVLTACSASTPTNKGVYLFLDTSGTYSGEIKKAQQKDRRFNAPSASAALAAASPISSPRDVFPCALAAGLHRNRCLFRRGTNCRGHEIVFGWALLLSAGTAVPAGDWHGLAWCGMMRNSCFATRGRSGRTGSLERRAARSSPSAVTDRV